jgi:hypothetical protein
MGGRMKRITTFELVTENCDDCDPNGIHKKITLKTPETKESLVIEARCIQCYTNLGWDTIDKSVNEEEWVTDDTRQV